jgi:hypothetical protein
MLLTPLTPGNRHIALLRRASLILPLDLAFERDPAFGDDDLDALPRRRQTALDGFYRLPRYLRVRPLVDGGYAHLDVVRHPAHSRDALCGGFRVLLVAVAANDSCEHNDTILHRHGDVRCIKARLPRKFILDVSFDVAVGSQVRFPWWMSRSREMEGHALAIWH